MPIRPFGINPGEINWAAKGARKGAFDSNALPWLSRNALLPLIMLINPK